MARGRTEMQGHHGCTMLPYAVLVDSSDVKLELNSGPRGPGGGEEGNVSENQACAGFWKWLYNPYW